MKHIVGFSGGIDSQATARWVMNRYPAEDVIVLNSDAGGNEHPLTAEFIAWYSTNVHEVVTVSAIYADNWETPGFAETRGLVSSDPLSFGELIRLRSAPPSRKRRFCTEVLKLRPQRRWMNEAFGPTGKYAGIDYERYSGVRRSESQSRKGTPFRLWDEFFDCWLNNPIADWSKPMCFEFVKAFGERTNQLYALGFGRVGCAPCGPNSNKEDILLWAVRFPGMIDKVEEWERTSGHTFFMPMGPGAKTNTVREVVEWAKTSRGGRQQLFPIMHERPACESKYGLCE